MGNSENGIIYHDFGSRRCDYPQNGGLQQRYREDWRRFYVIQLHQYLSVKRSGRLGSQAEGDMIRDLLAVYWEEILASGVLAGMGLFEKIRMFHDIQIDFPFIEVPAPEGFIPFRG